MVKVNYHATMMKSHVNSALTCIAVPWGGWEALIQRNRKRVIAAAAGRRLCEMREGVGSLFCRRKKEKEERKMTDDIEPMKRWNH